MTAPALVSDLTRVVGDAGIRTGAHVRPFLHDATEARGLEGNAQLAALPSDTAGVAAVMRYCYDHGVPLVPRGGGTGYAGGAVPAEGVVLSLERLRRLRSFEPLQWRGEVEAGVTTLETKRLAREGGLLYPPDPGAGEQSHIGGNVATNAGGPHSFKYGVTGAWITGLELVIPPGEIIKLGGKTRKDVAGYDLKSLVVGSEGTLAIVTAVSLRFIPMPEARLPVLAFYPDPEIGALSVQAAMASGINPSVIEFLDAEATLIATPSCPADVPTDTSFVVIAEADGSAREADEGRLALVESMAEGALAVHAPVDTTEIAAVWRWRDGIGLLADAALGHKVSEDISVPVDRLSEAVAGTAGIGKKYDLRSCSWGHAGDGNLHATFMFAADDAAAGERAARAAMELFQLAITLEGSISGEHGLGLVKNGQLRNQWPAPAVALHNAVKDMFDPRGLLNPGKKLA